jgi:hypothetical protein
MARGTGTRRPCMTPPAQGAGPAIEGCPSNAGPHLAVSTELAPGVRIYAARPAL